MSLKFLYLRDLSEFLQFDSLTKKYFILHLSNADVWGGKSGARCHFIAGIAERRRMLLSFYYHASNRLGSTLEPGPCSSPVWAHPWAPLDDVSAFF